MGTITKLENVTSAYLNLQAVFQSWEMGRLMTKDEALDKLKQQYSYVNVEQHNLHIA